MDDTLRSDFSDGLNDCIIQQLDGFDGRKRNVEKTATFLFSANEVSIVCSTSPRAPCR